MQVVITIIDLEVFQKEMLYPLLLQLEKLMVISASQWVAIH